MDEFERLSETLARQGFYASLRREPKGWHCDLLNSVIAHTLPSGKGATALEALQAADAMRREKSGK